MLKLIENGSNVRELLKHTPSDWRRCCEIGKSKFITSRATLALGEGALSRYAITTDASKLKPPCTGERMEVASELS